MIQFGVSDHGLAQALRSVIMGMELAVTRVEGDWRTGLRIHEAAL